MTELECILQDENAREIALDPKKSFIVRAPAGSGKTELLIQRYLSLLNCVQAPEEILAITFTKKAANEMRQRIIQALQSAEEGIRPSLTHARKTFALAEQALLKDKTYAWHVSANPNRLRIQTIDSLCAHLTMQLPLSAQFGAAPLLNQEPLYLYQEAVREVLTLIDHDPLGANEIETLLTHLDNDLNKLYALLVHLLEKRDQWFSYMHLDMNETTIRNKLEDSLKRQIEEHLQQIKTFLPQDIIQDLIAIARYAATNLPAQSTLNCRIYQDPLCYPQLAATDKTAWLGLAELLLTKEGNWRKRFDRNLGFLPKTDLKSQEDHQQNAYYREKLSDTIALLTESDRLKTLLFELFLLPPPSYGDEQWKILGCLFKILKMTLTQLRLAFKRYGQIDFIENTQGALLALQNQAISKDHTLKDDDPINHILIDEFQDTSYSHYRLIEKLVTPWKANDGRTLFIVGDPMQSIYRFREAEVGLFIKTEQEGIATIPLIPLVLKVNFRASPNLVSWVNECFQTIFPPLSDSTTGAVAFNKSVAKQDHQEVNNDTNKPGIAAVTIQGFANANAIQQAEYIIDQVNQLHTDNPKETIAIIVRSRSHLEELIPLFKSRGIAYAAQNIEPLSTRPHIQDLFSLTCALIHPADRLSWFALLRAPWCGLSLQDLLIIGSEKTEIICSKLNDETVQKCLSNDGKARLLRILPILNTKLQEQGRFTLRLWIERTWNLLGGPACLHHRYQLQEAHAFFNLLDECETEFKSANLKILNDKITQLYADSYAYLTSASLDETQKPNPVHIMTIHSAKGLEFDTVIIPHIERSIPSDPNPLLLWMENPQNRALLLAPIHASATHEDPIYRYIKTQHAIKASYETDRLLYVAVTRAKKRLYITFDAKIDEKNAIENQRSQSFLDRLLPVMQPTVALKTCTNHEEQSTIQVREDRKPRFLKRLTLAWQNPMTTIARPTFSPYTTARKSLRLNDPKCKYIGIVIHEILQRLAHLGNGWWQTMQKFEQENYTQRQLMRVGMPPEEMASAIHSVIQAIHNTLQDPRGQWILKNHREAKAELALTALIDNELKSMIIDRTFIDEKGYRWIIDYKTAIHKEEEKEEFLNCQKQHYLAQMNQYGEAMRAKNREEEIWLGLYFPAFPTFISWQG